MYSNVCRVCLINDDKMESLFNFSNKGELLTEIFQKVTNLEVQECDKFPKFICKKCLNDLKNAHNFIKKCIQSIKILEKYYSSTENGLKTKNNETDCDLFNNKIDNNLMEYGNENLFIKEETKEFLLENDCFSPAEVTSAEISEGSICNNSYTPEDILNEHLIFHKSSKFDEKLLDVGKLQVHKSSNNLVSSKRIYCQLCNKQFNNLSHLKRHSVSHTKKLLHCEVCNRKCITERSLNRHVRIHKSSLKSSKHTCTICSKEFQFRSLLTEHMKNHTGEKPFLCSTCGKGFRQSGTLKYHLRTHTGYKPYACNVCNTSFISGNILKVHMRRHTNERPYICDVCGRAFRQNNDMKMHKRTQHIGYDPVECTVCHKKLSRTGALTVHMRTHTGEKPFRCATCNKGFVTSALLARHSRVHTGEKPYVCNLCKRGFSQSSSLRKHMETHTKDKKSS